MHDIYDTSTVKGLSDLSRRDALKRFAAFGTAYLTLSTVNSRSSQAQAVDDQELFEALYYIKLENKKIKCTLCPKECVIDNMERGFCGVRENLEGIYYTYVYSRPCSIHKDPIEKKPLFHFMPGTAALSIATVGCNMDCKFCQNWQISQMRPEQSKALDVSPEKMAHLAAENDCPAIAYTYTEPVIFYEYMYDCAIAGHERNVRSVMISNGYIKQKPMEELVKHLDAVKIDLKAFTEKFYREICIGELKPVLDTLILLRKMDVWTEIVYLIVPTLNDDTKELKDMCRWIVRELGTDVPIHFTRFHPQYKLKNLPPTPLESLENARNCALDAGINYVYIGNIPRHPGESTYCPNCKKPIIYRIGYAILDYKIKGGKCSLCGHAIPGVWV